MAPTDDTTDKANLMPPNEPLKPVKPASALSNDVFAFELSEGTKRFAKRYRTEISSGSSTVMSTFAAFPLDFAKSRMQSYNAGFLETVKDAYKAEGLRGFWRGVSTPLASVTAVRTISFSIYQSSKYRYDEWIRSATGTSPLSIANSRHMYPNLYTVACFGMAGATSGAMITLVSCPFELIKLNAQLAGKMAREPNTSDRPAPISDIKTGALRTAQSLVRQRGVRGLYLGWRLHTVRDTIGTSLYFVTYESVKQILSNAQGSSPADPGAVAIAGALCGIVSWACIYPIDVVKTVYQKRMLAVGTGQAEIARQKIRFFQRGSYRGLGISCLRSAVINTIFFSSFEWMKRNINALELDEAKARRDLGD